jgi:hypothetical protein
MQMIMVQLFISNDRNGFAVAAEAILPAAHKCPGNPTGSKIFTAPIEICSWKALSYLKRQSSFPSDAYRAISQPAAIA